MHLHREGLRGLAISGSLRSAFFGALRNRCLLETTLEVKALEEICSYTEDLGNEPALPAAAAQRSAVVSSDRGMVATPGYNHGIAGLLWNALNWGSRPVFAACLLGKSTLIISSAPTFTGAVCPQRQPRETLTSMHARIVPGREILVGEVAKKMKEERFSGEQSDPSINTGLDRLRQISSAQEVSA